MTPTPATLRDPLRRYRDWPLRLEAFVRARRHQPFAWGQQDCALLAADCVLALAGVDLAPPALRAHRSARQALRLLQQHGGLAQLAHATLGPACPVAQATVGDLLLTRSQGRPMLAICNGSSALAPGALGLVSLGLQDVSHAWRVG